MISRILILFLILIQVTLATNFVQDVNAGENEWVLPELFETQKEAVKNGCKKVYLKDRNQESYVIETGDIHTFLITVYDKNSKGQFIKSNQICVPSWYGKASVEYKDILPDGKELLFVKFEGNTGTGTLQMILMIIRWQDNEFVPIFVETISYDLEGMGYKQELKVSYTLENIKTNQLSMDLNYGFKVLCKADPAINFKAAWNDRLIWDEKTGSFYKDEYNRSIVNAPFYVQRNIARVRQLLRSIRISDLCNGFFEKTGIMEILIDGTPKGDVVY